MGSTAATLWSGVSQLLLSTKGRSSGSALERDDAEERFMQLLKKYDLHESEVAVEAVVEAVEEQVLAANETLIHVNSTVDEDQNITTTEQDDYQNVTASGKNATAINATLLILADNQTKSDLEQDKLNETVVVGLDQ